MIRDQENQENQGIRGGNQNHSVGRPRKKTRVEKETKKATEKAIEKKTEKETEKEQPSKRIIAGLPLLFFRLISLFQPKKNHYLIRVERCRELS